MILWPQVRNLAGLVFSSCDPECNLASCKHKFSSIFRQGICIRVEILPCWALHFKQQNSLLHINIVKFKMGGMWNTICLGNHYHSTSWQVTISKCFPFNVLSWRVSPIVKLQTKLLGRIPSSIDVGKFQTLLLQI